MKRINSIDIVRGFVMVIMALDHTRDLLHVKALTEDPTNLSSTTPALFFTRWITHFCAPSFVFLAGVSVWLSSFKRSVAAQRKFLIKRGLWLILLEFTLITFGIWWDIRFSVFLLQVIAAIGFGFVILGLFLPVPARILGVAGLLILIFHGLVSLIPAAPGSFTQRSIALLFTGGFRQVTPHTSLIIGYPLIPWLGIILAGYGAGIIFQKEQPLRRIIFLRIGMAATGLFVLLRALNLYGDPVHWTPQKDLVFTVMSFLNLSKYPPSLLFSLMTLGGMFFLLWFAEGMQNRFSRMLDIYGRVPMFYYLVHWYLIHTTMFLVLFMQGFGIGDFRFGFSFGRPEQANGLGLPGVYAIWLSIVVILFPFCKWYGKYKSTHREKWWLQYL